MIPRLIRPHRGLLEESIALVQQIKTWDDVRRFLAYHQLSTSDNFRWEMYHDQPDERPGLGVAWPETYIIDANPGVIGFANFSIWELIR